VYEREALPAMDKLTTATTAVGSLWKFMSVALETALVLLVSSAEMSWWGGALYTTSCKHSYVLYRFLLVFPH
jgi:hypothetical protein